jgi:hypothetical protein
MAVHILAEYQAFFFQMKFGSCGLMESLIASVDVIPSTKKDYLANAAE